MLTVPIKIGAGGTRFIPFSTINQDDDDLVAKVIDCTHTHTRTHMLWMWVRKCVWNLFATTREQPFRLQGLLLLNFDYSPPNFCCLKSLDCTNAHWANFISLHTHTNMCARVCVYVCGRQLEPRLHLLGFRFPYAKDQSQCQRQSQYQSQLSEAPILTWPYRSAT